MSSSTLTSTTTGEYGSTCAAEGNLGSQSSKSLYLTAQRREGGDRRPKGGGTRKDDEGPQLGCIALHLSWRRVVSNSSKITGNIACSGKIT